MSDDRTFMIYANDAVEEIDPDGDTYIYGEATGLFAELVFGGYPLMRDDCAAFDGCVDLRTDGTSVIAHTSGTAPYEHDMGPAGELFLDWYRASV